MSTERLPDDRCPHGVWAADYCYKCAEPAPQLYSAGGNGPEPTGWMPGMPEDWSGETSPSPAPARRLQQNELPDDLFRAAPSPRAEHPDTHAFKNFHRSLCERFGYIHDEVDWRRDLVSLEEWIAAKVAAPRAEGQPYAPHGSITICCLCRCPLGPDRERKHDDHN